jgi:hypothetical protein
MEAKLPAPAAPEAPAPRPRAAQATVPPNTAFQIAADASGDITTEYRLEKDGGVAQTKPVSALANGVIQFALPAGVPAGTHAFAVRAVRIIPQGQVMEYFSPPWTESVVAGQPFVKTVTVPPAAAPTLPVTHMKLYKSAGGLGTDVVLQTQPVTGPSVTFSVTGLAAGPTEFKYGTVSTASAITELASPALDSTISVVAQVVDTLTTDASKYAAGAPVTLTWTVAAPNAADWIGIFDVNTNANVGKASTNAAATGKVTIPAPSMPTGGFYYGRYCLASGFCAPVSAAFFVEAVSTTPTCKLSEPSCTTTTSPCVNGQQTKTETCKQVPIPNDPPGCVPPAPVEKKTETVQSCTVPVTGTVVVTACTFQLTSKSPDGSTSGWVAQFKRGTTLTTNVGSVDKSSPYQRSASLAPGTYTFFVEWTKGTTTVTTQLGTKNCEK